MVLSKHVDVEQLIKDAQEHPHLKHTGNPKSRARQVVAYSGRYQTEALPRYEFPSNGVSEPAAYHTIKGELALDGSPTLNLASFVHTSMPDYATKLVSEHLNINIVDQDEYPATLDIHDRCVSMIADLWKAPKKKPDGSRSQAVGTATTGSSEAIMLGGLAMKRRWQDKMKAAGKSWKEPGPNVVFGSNAQVCIEKFARYFDVEGRLVPISEESNYCLNPKLIESMVDENTIGVIVILGSTYTGHYEPVEEVAKILDDIQARTGLDIPIHVDGASGGFVAPFAHPHLKWNFEIPRVVSINSSGHKFGMVYAGLGWIIWRDQEHLHKDLIFELHYLGSVEYSFNLNFSRPAAPVLAQYFNFINLGFKGYRNVMVADMANARLLSRALESSGYFLVLSDIHRPRNTISNAAVKTGIVDEDDPEYYVPGLPVVSFRLTDEYKKKNPHVDQKWIQTLLRARHGFIVPNYNLSPNLEHIDILRVVCRENLSESMIDQLVHDILSIVEDLADASSTTSALAALMHKEPGQAQGQSKHGHKHSHHSTKLTKELHHLGEGQGTKPVGYAKQC
ncbi:glutamate decarboxylase gad1 [Tilletia horrida]|nr:glutamate decarboxylase gad1 [Tilletia horrida]